MQRSEMLLLLLVVLSFAIATGSTTATTSPSCHGLENVYRIRGGLVPQASETGGNYYEQFELDYGTADKRRIAGSMRGFINGGKIASLPEVDPFLKWMNENLEKGPETSPGRLKPFYVSYRCISENPNVMANSLITYPIYLHIS